MKKKDENYPIEILWVKFITQLISLVVLVVMVILLPKTVFDDPTPFRLATSMALIDKDSLLLYDYQVYATEARFNQGLTDDLKTVHDSFKSRSELLAVQVNGNDYRVEYREDYIFINNPEIIELNIEYYVVRNLQFDGITIPVRTFIILFNDVARLINTIYRVIFIALSLFIFSRLTIKSTMSLLKIKKLKVNAFINK